MAGARELRAIAIEGERWLRPKHTRNCNPPEAYIADLPPSNIESIIVRRQKQFLRDTNEETTRHSLIPNCLNSVDERGLNAPVSNIIRYVDFYILRASK